MVSTGLWIGCTDTTKTNEVTTTTTTEQPENIDANKAAGQEQPAAPTGTGDPTQERAVIEKYVADNGLKGQFSPEGIFYAVEKQGNGKNPTAENVVQVHYKGTLLNGEQFDSSYDRGEPATFPLRQVIPGWTMGIPMFKEGGKGTLVIPSGMAYGPGGRPGIPPNSILRFDVEVIKIMQ